MSGPDDDATKGEKLAYWQGSVDKQMEAGDTRFDKIDEAIERLDSSLDAVKTKLTKIEVKVAIYGALSAAIVTFIGTLVSKGL
jgi:hypothetical protein